MNVAELFINLGVKGTDKTVGALSGVGTTLKSTSSMALETKAAILGAMYALERLFATSNQRGTDLTNFNAETGVTVKTLQQYQYAARQVGASNEEMAGTFKGLQDSITKTLYNMGAPSGLAQVGRVTGKIKDQFELAKMKPQDLLQVLQEYAQKEQNIGLRNITLKSFGISDTMIAALVRGAFKKSIMDKAPVYSDKEVKTLDENRKDWANLGNTIEMSVGKFNAKYGKDIVEGIGMIVPKVLELATAFLELGKAVGFSGDVKNVFYGWSQILNVVVGQIVAISNALKGGTFMKETWEATKEEFKMLGILMQSGPQLHGVGSGGDMPFGGRDRGDTREKDDRDHTGNPDAVDKAVKGFFGGKSIGSRGDVPLLPVSGNAAAPTVSPTVNNAAAVTNNNTVNQTQVFQHDGKNAPEVGDAAKKGVRDALRSNPSQAGGY